MVSVTKSHYGTLSNPSYTSRPTDTFFLIGPGWRLLSTVHAENDDDRGAIAAATKAHSADPTDLEALLSLAVSHTNELDQEEATGYMRAWLRHQPRFAQLEQQHTASFAANPEQVGTPAATLDLFKRAVSLAPRDADVHAVLGVLAHLLRSYDEAIDAFNTALDVNPNDYSLWNKLGATQANSDGGVPTRARFEAELRPSLGEHGNRVREPGQVRTELRVLRPGAFHEPQRGVRVGLFADFLRVLRQDRADGSGGREGPGEAGEGVSAVTVLLM